MCSQRLRCDTRETIYNSRTVAMMLEEFDHALIGVFLRLHQVSYVRPVETRNEYFRIAERQPFDYVLSCDLICSRGKRHEWNVGHARFQIRQHSVFRSEIVPPLGNTMCLINGDETHIHGGQSLQINTF